jgi:hypothetical protein
MFFFSDTATIIVLTTTVSVSAVSPLTIAKTFARSNPLTECATYLLLIARTKLVGNELVRTVSVPDVRHVTARFGELAT